MPNLKEHLENASYGGFNVESIETLTAQIRELTRLVGKGNFREAGNLAAAMEARCAGLTGQCFRAAERIKANHPEVICPNCGLSSKNHKPCGSFAQPIA